MDEDLRLRMGKAALAVASEAGYTNAGTVEFLVDKDRNFYFIEVNARLQVEHPVTELVTGIDLVEAQIAIAEGAELPISQDDVVLRGHAIECRIYAEDPDNNFAPSPGVVETLRIPGGPGIRDDSCLFEGYEVPIYYDPIVGKLIAWGHDRPAAIRRLQRALEEYKVRGISTTIPLFERVLADPDFLAAEFDTSYLERFLDTSENGDAAGFEDIAEAARIAAALHVFLSEEARAYRPPSTTASPWKLAGRAAGLDGES
jgi:acetyl-CoA carboxylase biotin carboxylase subunit